MIVGDSKMRNAGIQEEDFARRSVFAALRRAGREGSEGSIHDPVWRGFRENISDLLGEP